MYKLYWAVSTSAFVVEAVLAEAELEYERIVLDRSRHEHHEPWYRDINPLGQIPTLVLPDGTAITESAACALHLSETHSRCGLLPAPGTAQKARVLQWLSFAQAQLYETHLREFFAARYVDGETCVDASRINAARRFDDLLAIVDAALGRSRFLAGDNLLLADIYVAMIASWHSDPARLRTAHPRVGRLIREVYRRAKLGPLWLEHNSHRTWLVEWITSTAVDPAGDI